MSMDDLIKSIKAYLYDRATSPLFGTFAISWSIWNYKFLLVLVSSMPADEKINYISIFLYPSMHACVFPGAVYPLLTAMAFIFVYPYPARLVYSFTQNMQKELRDIKQKVEDKTLLTIEESRKIRRDMTNHALEHEKEMARKNSEIAKLKELIDEMARTSAEDSLGNEGPALEGGVGSYNLDDEKLNLLRLVAEHEDANEQDLIQWSKANPIKTQFNLGELNNLKLIRGHTVNGQARYSATHPGRKVLVSMGYIS